jgi:hypothetical protein
MSLINPRFTNEVSATGNVRGLCSESNSAAQADFDADCILASAILTKVEVGKRNI